MAYRIGQVLIDNTSGDYDENTNIFNENIKGAGTWRSGIPYLQRFGVQSRPGAIFRIGQEQIRIGRSGVYELASDLVKVTDIGVISEDIFIIDFKY